MGSNRFKAKVVICAAGIVATLSLAYALARFIGKRAQTHAYPSSFRRYRTLLGLGFTSNM